MFPLEVARKIQDEIFTSTANQLLLPQEMTTSISVLNFQHERKKEHTIQGRKSFSSYANWASLVPILLIGSGLTYYSISSRNENSATIHKTRQTTDSADAVKTSKMKAKSPKRNKTTMEERRNNLGQKTSIAIPVLRNASFLPRIRPSVKVRKSPFSTRGPLHTPIPVPLVSPSTSGRREDVNKKFKAKETLTPKETSPSVTSKLEVLSEPMTAHDEYRHLVKSDGGKGLLRFEDGSFYEGELDGQQRSGVGRQVHCDGESFEGHWKNDKKDGKGIVYANICQVCIEGMWKDDNLDMTQKVKRTSLIERNVFEGYLKDHSYGRLSGIGIIRSVFEILYGEFLKNNIKAGYLVLKDSSGCIEWGRCAENGKRTFVTSSAIVSEELYFGSIRRWISSEVCVGTQTTWKLREGTYCKTGNSIFDASIPLTQQDLIYGTELMSTGLALTSANWKEEEPRLEATFPFGGHVTDGDTLIMKTGEKMT